MGGALNRRDVLRAIVAGVGGSASARWVSNLRAVGQEQAAAHAGAMAAAPAEQADLLTRLSTEGNPTREETIGRDFFTAVKTLTITGYYTTEVGMRQELGDDGRLMLTTFEGCTHEAHGVRS